MVFHYMLTQAFQGLIWSNVRGETDDRAEDFNFNTRQIGMFSVTISVCQQPGSSKHGLPCCSPKNRCLPTLGRALAGWSFNKLAISIISSFHVLS
jgi:hypothetical protein